MQWQPYTDETAAAAASGATAERFVLSFELEAVYDAVAFSFDTRALRAAVSESGVVSLVATLPYDSDATAEEAFSRDVEPSLKDDEACFLLFRTKTWALATWAPAGAGARGRRRDENPSTPGEARAQATAT